MSTTQLSKPVAHWQRVCQSHIRTPNIKRADLGGDGQSVPFEQAFSNLAHAYLKDRAPQLLDHELGFQLLEKNEDNDRAVGIFGFRVGSQLLYAPVFFLNGELKGHELLYLKDSDTFVPMKENWINYVLNRKPNIIGEELGPNLANAGVDRPNMDVFRESPAKYAADQADQADWLAPALPGLMHVLGNAIRPEMQCHGLVKENADCAHMFLQLLDKHPSLVSPVTEVYGKQMIKDAIDTAKTLDTVSPTGVPRKRKSTHITGSIFTEKSASDLAQEQLAGKLKIWKYDDSSPTRARQCAAGLTEKQAQNLKRDGVYVSDERTEGEVSKAYKVQEPLSLMNPDASGIYQVLTKPDDFEECLYIHGPFNARGTKPNGVLVRIGDGDKAWTETHPAAIYTSDEYTGDTYSDWFEKQPEAKSLSVGSTYVLVAPNGQGTSVFEVESTLPAEGEEKSYEVRWRNRWGARRPDHLPPIAERRHEYDSDCAGADTVMMNRIKGRKFVARLNCLYVPEGAKAVKIKGPEKPKKHDGLAYVGDHEESSDPPALRPGNHVDLQMGIYKISEELQVFNNGTEAIVDGRHMTPLGAFVHLVRDYGLREKTAKALLTEAELKRGVKCRVKMASPYQALGHAPTAPAFPEPDRGTDMFMGSNVPTTNSFQGDEMELPVQGMQGSPNRQLMSDPVEPQMGQQIQEAAQTGQKEVLDTAMMSNLLKGTQNETLIDKHLSNLMKGLDSLGRLLFNMYWHHDKFEDRYGGNNLPEMTDAMRNAFESLGDVTLELKQKSVEPYPDEGVDMGFGEGEM